MAEVFDAQLGSAIAYEAGHRSVRLPDPSQDFYVLHEPIGNPPELAEIGTGARRLSSVLEEHGDL